MKRFLTLFVLAFALVSCGASKFYVGNASSTTPVALVEPYTYLTDAIADFQTDYVQDVSVANQTLLKEIVSALGVPVAKLVPFEYFPTDRSDFINGWMRSFRDLTPAAASGLEIPGEIRDAVANSGCRYGMILVDLGYVKNAKQYALERGVETGLNVMNFIVNGELNLSHDSEAFMNGVYSVIFDNQSGEVVWFGKRHPDYKHNPLDRGDMTDQLRKLYKDFLK